MTALATAEELDRALPEVLAALLTDAPVHLLCTRPRYNQRVFPERLSLTRHGGVEGDFEMSMPWLKLDDGRPDPRNQVSILPLRVLDLVWRNRSETVHPGDTIVADLNTSEANLPVGTLLRVGSVVLRVSDVDNFGCAKWRVRYGKPALAWVASPANRPYRLRGIFCSIEEDGEVALGDRIVKLGDVPPLGEDSIRPRRFNAR